MILRFRARAVGPALTVTLGMTLRHDSSGHVICDVLLRVLFLRQTRSSHCRTPLCRMDVKYACRGVLVDPAGAPRFGRVLDTFSAITLSWNYSRSLVVVVVLGVSG